MHSLITCICFCFVEATSALDLASEAAMYALLQAMDITYVSVGHRPSLLRYHDQKLVLCVPGSNKPPMMVDLTNEKEKVDLTAELVDLSYTGDP